MQKSKIEWCDSTWNPVTGCLHGCAYCYARRIAERFSGRTVEGKISRCGSWGKNTVELDEPFMLTRKDSKTVKAPFPFGFRPTLHRYRLDEPYQRRGQNIFVCSMADLFGEWVPDEWIEEVMKACLLSPQHRYLFLTKNPGRYMKLAEAGKLPERDNFWYGSSTPTPDAPFWCSEHHNTFVSIEPMMDEFPSAGDCSVKKVGWIIMGAMTGPGSKAYQPKKEWVESLVEDAMASVVPVFMKDSLLPIVGEAGMRRELPWDHQKEV